MSRTLNFGTRFSRGQPDKIEPSRIPAWTMGSPLLEQPKFVRQIHAYHGHVARRGAKPVSLPKLRCLDDGAAA